MEFIKKLAEYEKLVHEVEATTEGLHEALFVRHEAEVVFGKRTA